MNKHSSVKQPRSDFAERPAQTKRGPHAANRIRKETSAGTAVVSAGLNKLLVNRWLHWQCRLLSDVMQSAVFEVKQQRCASSAIACWPKQQFQNDTMAVLANDALQAKKSQVRANVTPDGNSKGACDFLACPINIDDEIALVVTLQISPRSQAQQQAVFQLLEWGGWWLESLCHQPSLQDNAQCLLGWIEKILTLDDAQKAQHFLVNVLADRLSCHRVSIGLFRNNRVTVSAISHSQKIDGKQQLLRDIESLMDESIRQGQRLIAPSRRDNTIISYAHQSHLRKYTTASLCTFVLSVAGQPVGAICCERMPGKDFSEQDGKFCDQLATLISPIITARIEREKSIDHRVIKRVVEPVRKLLGPNHYRFKVTAMAVVMSLVAVLMIKVDYRIAANASVQSEARQQLVAMQDSFVSGSYFRAGDRVTKGQIIATFEDKSLKLEKNKWLGQRRKLDKEFQHALANRDRAMLSILQARTDEVDAEIGLIDNKLQATVIAAPMDGVIVSGDLSQSLGAPINIGTVLYEVAPLEGYRVILEADEHDIADIRIGMSGKLLTTSLPDTYLGFTVDNIVAMAVTADGHNYFHVEAKLDEKTALLRPGMQGVAKVSIGERQLLWVMTHRLVDRLRLAFWSLGGLW